MKKTIYNVYVPMTSQEQCDRMKQVCVENGLDYWKDKIAFLNFTNYDYFLFGKNYGFAVYSSISLSDTQVTESEFLELLKEHNQCTNQQ